MYDSKTGIKITPLSSAQYDHLFYLLLYANRKRQRPWVSINSPQAVIQYKRRTLDSLWRKGLVERRNCLAISCRHPHYYRASKAGVISFKYAQVHPHTIKGVNQKPDRARQLQRIKLRAGR